MSLSTESATTVFKYYHNNVLKFLNTFTLMYDNIEFTIQILNGDKVVITSSNYVNTLVLEGDKLYVSESNMDNELCTFNVSFVYKDGIINFDVLLPLARFIFEKYEPRITQEEIDLFAPIA